MDISVELEESVIAGFVLEALSPQVAKDQVLTLDVKSLAGTLAEYLSAQIVLAEPRADLENVRYTIDRAVAKGISEGQHVAGLLDIPLSTASVVAKAASVAAMLVFVQHLYDTKMGL